MEEYPLTYFTSDKLPAVSEYLTGVTPTQCARLCHSQPSCLMFYLGDDGECYITDANQAQDKTNIATPYVYIQSPT